MAGKITSGCRSPVEGVVSLPPSGGASAQFASVWRKGIGAHSGDCNRPFQAKVITDSGDRDHVLTRPTEAA